MKQALYAIAMTALAAMPASAGTSFWFTCDFQREGELDSDSFGLFFEGGGTFVRHGIQTNIVWLETGDTVHLFAADEWPQRWLISFNSDEMVAVSWNEGIAVHSSTCRLGAE